MRSSKTPTTASSQRRQQNASSSASIRSFQSDLERINEDYNKTYAYTGQTSANAMRTAAPASVRGRRAESVASSVMSDTSEVAGEIQRRKASRVSFSDVDESEGRSRGPSPNPERRRSALKNPSPASIAKTGVYTANGVEGAGRGSNGSMPPSALIRRASNSSLHSNTSAAGLGNVPFLAAPLQKSTQQVPVQSVKGEDGDLSTIGENNSAYSDADEEFKASPALKRQQATDGTPAPSLPLQLTEHNLAAATGTAAVTRFPTKSAMKTPSRAGSVTLPTLDTESQLDVADDESDDSFAARRKAKKVAGRTSLTTLRGKDAPRRDSTSVTETAPARATLVRSTSITSQQSRVSQGPSRMVSLRQSQPQAQKRQSLQGSRTSSYDNAPAMTRRTSMQSLLPPAPPKSARRASVAGSVDDNRSDAVSNHIAVMEIAQRRIQQMLHPDAVNNADDSSLATFADAPERKKSSFERKRPTTLSRQNSNSSMVSRSLRNPMAEPPVLVKAHKRAASDEKAFATTLRSPRPSGQRSSSMIITGPTDSQSVPNTPKKSGLRRMSFQFRRGNIVDDDVPPVPAMRRYSSDSSIALPTSRKDTGTALSAGTLRSGSRNASESYGKKTSKPKKFQALRRLLKIN